MKPGHTTTQHQEQVLSGWNNISHYRQQTAIVGLQARLPRKMVGDNVIPFLGIGGGLGIKESHGVLVIGTWARDTAQGMVHHRR